MILDRELDLPSARRDPPARGQFDVSRPGGISNALVFALLLAVVLILQAASGAYHSEFNGYPDESAHYVTSLMVRQYITAPHPGAPVPFAQDYYAHYPKVAFGHWPPLLYVVQAVWMSLFSPARASLLLELALTTTLLAYSVFSQARRWFTRRSYRMAASVFAGLLIVCIPLIQTYTDEEMSETLLALMCFWSAIYFTRYLDSGRWQDNCLFGVFFALAVLTKGSGWLLTLLPAIALLLTRKLHLLLRPSFWLAALIVRRHLHSVAAHDDAFGRRGLGRRVASQCSVHARRSLRVLCAVPPDRRSGSPAPRAYRYFSEGVAAVVQTAGCFRSGRDVLAYSGRLAVSFSRSGGRRRSQIDNRAAAACSLRGRRSCLVSSPPASSAAASKVEIARYRRSCRHHLLRAYFRPSARKARRLYRSGPLYRI